ncbi:hypothetical protein ATO10_09478 [Actibacterium atlanticum]|uniref:SGNH hydrolase-type esterase domain-containing protein n=1 Tax=Actibacterium atlanticum TaxID=1461693 RepID=A0A058ZLJ2_9RHOB|nr:SGNH/GDSL hydrolase family protein [Actibacterium atlanticum]KCV82067.1 hypothetical protein ATO10_09478 [Actibacterium atlanticum]
MTVYIFGGSNTAMKNGWATSFAQQVMRRVPVQNLALGATNSINALTRLMEDVILKKDDVVIWSNATNDAFCLSSRPYDEARMLEAVERMIQITRAAGARFLPVLIDTFPQHLMVQQEEFASRILHMCSHYQLEVVNLPQAYAAETGTMQARAEYFIDGLHMTAGGELSEYVAELTEGLWRRGGNYPADVPTLWVPDGVEMEVFSAFDQPDMSQHFESLLIAKETWLPPVTATPVRRQGMTTEIQAITILADPVHGRFNMDSGEQSLTVSAIHNFGFTGNPLIVMVTPRLMIPGGMFLPDDASAIRFSWDDTHHPVPTDMYLKPAQDRPATGESSARVVSLLLRHMPESSVEH